MTKPRYEIVDNDNSPKKPRYEIVDDDTDLSDVSPNPKPDKNTIFNKDFLISMLGNALPSELSLLPRAIKAAPILSNDIGNAIGKIPDILQNAADSISPLIQGNINNLQNNPMRIGKNLLVGGSGILQDIINLPHEASAYANHLGQNIPNIPGTPDFTSKLKQNLLGEYKEGDELSSFIRNLPALFGVAGAGKSALSALGKGSKGLVNWGNVKNAQKALNAANETHEINKELMKEAQGAATRELGLSNHNKIKFNLDKQQEHINSINSELSNLPDMNNMHGPNLSSNLTRDNLNVAEKAHNSTQEMSSNIDELLDKFLNKDANHDVRIAQKVKEIQEGIRKNVSRGYDDLEQKLKNEKVIIPNNDTIKDLNEQIYNLIKSKNINSPEIKSLGERLNKIGENEEIPANEYISAYKSVRQYARDARKKAYSTGMNEEERQAHFQRMENLEDKADEMENILSDNIGGENLDLLKKNASDWRTKVVPLQKNRLYQKFLHEERGPSDIIHELRGNPLGHENIRSIIKNDPEALKNLIGQRYFSKPKDILNPDEVTQQFINYSPEIKSLLDSKRVNSESLSKAKENLNFAQESHRNALAREKEAKGIKESKEDLFRQRNELEEKISVMNKHIDNLSKFDQARHISLRQKLAAKENLKKAQQTRYDYFNKMKKIMVKLGVLGIGGGAYYSSNKILGE